MKAFSFSPHPGKCAGRLNINIVESRNRSKPFHLWYRASPVIFAPGGKLDIYFNILILSKAIKKIGHESKLIPWRE